MELETINGERSDVLEAIKGELNPPEWYIGHVIFPVDLRAEKTGDIYYQTLTADSAAQTSRAAGAAPTATFLATSNTSYSAAEYNKRYAIARDEVKSYGGVENADRAGVKAAVRSCFRSFEDVAAGKVIDATGYGNAVALASGKVFEGLQKAAQNVKRYPGKLVLVCSHDWFLDFISQADVKEAIQATFGNGGVQQLQQLWSREPEAMKMMMATVMQFDTILIGDNEHWQVTDREDGAAIIKIPDPASVANRDDLVMLYKERPVYGISEFWLPDPVNNELLFKAESFYERKDVANYYDAYAWFDILELNAGAKQIVTLPSQTFATTTP